MKKKILASAIASTMCLSIGLCGCANLGGGDGSNDAEPNYAFSVCDVYAWKGYPATEFTPVFEDPAYAEELSFDYDAAKISLSETDRTVTALTTGVATVTVTSAHYETNFKVYCEEVDKNDECFQLVRSSNNDGVHIWLDCRRQPDACQFEWDVSGNENKTTLFIGDSYMDPGFFTEFENFYSDKDALCWGIGGSDSFTWETLLPLVFTETSPKNPKNIVMHVGTNDVYNTDNTDTDYMTARVTSSLQRIFTLMHNKFPDTNIYWFTITDRVYDGAEERYDTVHGINANMIEWGKGKDWITIVDTNPEVKFWMMKSDGTHVKAEEYGVFVDALYSAGIDILDKN
ncbi:MAG: SGNH/GDSL hydrolase family protein [Clostridia bacterium]|nr:SGNH/GDSL hydrolase family protein [Clostridia bacterium]